MARRRRFGADEQKCSEFEKLLEVSVLLRSLDSWESALRCSWHLGDGVWDRGQKTMPLWVLLGVSGVEDGGVLGLLPGDRARSCNSGH